MASTSPGTDWIFSIGRPSSALLRFLSQARATSSSPPAIASSERKRRTNKAASSKGLVPRSSANSPFFIRDTVASDTPMMLASVCAVKAMAVLRLSKDEFGILRLGDWTAMDKYDDVTPDAQRRLGPSIDERRALIEPERGSRPDRAAGRQAEMADDDVGPGLCHRLCLLGLKYIGRGQHVLVVRHPDHIDFEPIA